MKGILSLTMLLISSFYVLAQNNAADTSKRFAITDYQSIWPDFPLIILNDKPYKGDLKDLNVKAKYIEIYKGPGATAIFGISAGNGVIVIGSKHKSPKYFYKPSTDTTFSGPIIYINDGHLGEKNYIDQKDILKREVIGGDKLNSIYGRKLDSIVIITTRPYAIKQYKKKFSNLSQSYRNYLQHHNNNDSDLGYVINGDWKDRKQDDRINELFSIPAKKIKYIGFLDSETICCDFRSCLVITTKQ